MLKTYKFQTSLLLSALLISCTPNTNSEENVVEFRINNDSSFDVRNISIEVLAFNNIEDFWMRENLDTVSIEIPFIPRKNFSDSYYEILDNSVQMLLYYDQVSSKDIGFSVKQVVTDTVVNGDYRKLEAGSYTLRLENKFLYAYNELVLDNLKADSIWVRVLNRTDTDLFNFELTLDQEKPDDPNDIETRSQVEYRTYKLCDLQKGEFSEYVHTKLLFNDPRSFTLTARGQDSRITNPNFESYFYEGKQELNPGLYTLEIIDDVSLLDVAEFIKD